MVLGIFAVYCFAISVAEKKLSPFLIWIRFHSWIHSFCVHMHKCLCVHSPARRALAHNSTTIVRFVINKKKLKTKIALTLIVYEQWKQISFANTRNYTRVHVCMCVCVSLSACDCQCILLHIYMRRRRAHTHVSMLNYCGYYVSNWIYSIVKSIERDTSIVV